MSHRVVVLITCLAALHSVMIAQAISPTLPERLNAAAQSDIQTIRAGRTASIRFTLNEPAPRDFSFTSSLNCEPYNVGGFVKKGDKEAVVSVTIPKEAPSAQCQAGQITIEPGPNPDGKIVTPTVITLAKPVVFKIEGLPRVAEVMPSEATGQLELDEKEFFFNAAIPLRALRDNLTAVLDKNAADTNELRVLLVGVLEAADQRLSDTEKTYIAKYQKGAPLPRFFW